MDKIRKFISKALAFIYVFIFSVCKKKKVVVNNKILIIATGHMGNAVMDIDAVMAIKKIFIQEGKEVYLLCPPTIWIAFNLIEDMSGITYIGDKCYYGGYDTDFKNVYKIVNALKGYEFEKIIVTLTNDPEAHYVVAGLSFNQSYGVFDDIRHTAGGLRYYFEKYYTNKIIAPMNMHEFQRLKLLVQALGEVKYETGIRFIKPTESVTSRKKPYITIAMDSMVTARRWPIEKYIQFAEYVLENTDYLVYLTGSKIDPKDRKNLEAILKNKKVFNFIGKTSLTEWIEMLRGSSFHLSVDSGSVHFAASVGTPCVCLCGVWDGTRCMPYQFDLSDSRTSTPICVYQKDYLKVTENCYACKMKTGKFGIGNDLCRKAVNNKKPCLCLSNIEVSQVIEAFNEMI